MNKGFTLVEIIIVLGIIGILTSLAYPSYQDYLTRTRRTEGQSALLDLANRMEAYYAENETYATHSNSQDRMTTQNHYYQLAIVDATQTTYTLIATPLGTQALNDKQCQSLTFNHIGKRDITNGPAGAPTGVAEQCWK